MRKVVHVSLCGRFYPLSKPHAHASVGTVLLRVLRHFTRRDGPKDHGNGVLTGIETTAY